MTMTQIMAQNFLRAVAGPTEAAHRWICNQETLELDRVADYLCDQCAEHDAWRETHDSAAEYLYEMFVAAQPHFVAPVSGGDS